jgi:hypothetical protein
LASIDALRTAGMTRGTGWSFSIALVNITVRSGMRKIREPRSYEGMRLTADFLLRQAVHATTTRGRFFSTGAAERGFPAAAPAFTSF